MGKNTSKRGKNMCDFVKKRENALWKTCGKPVENGWKSPFFIFGKRKNTKNNFLGKSGKIRAKNPKSFPQTGVENLCKPWKNKGKNGENIGRRS